MITKPAVTRAPLIITAAGTYSASPREVVSIHYVNTTAGVGQVSIKDGNSANAGITLGAAAQGGSDDWCPAQPAKFDKLVVTFDTGTGVITVQTN